MSLMTPIDISPQGRMKNAIIKSGCYFLPAMPNGSTILWLDKKIKTPLIVAASV